MNDAPIKYFFFFSYILVEILTQLNSLFWISKMGAKICKFLGHCQPHIIAVKLICPRCWNYY